MTHGCQHFIQTKKEPLTWMSVIYTHFKSQPWNYEYRPFIRYVWASYWQDIYWSTFDSNFFSDFDIQTKSQISVWFIIFSVSHFLWDPLTIHPCIYSFNKYLLSCIMTNTDTVKDLDYKMINMLLPSVCTISGVYQSPQERKQTDFNYQQRV